MLKKISLETLLIRLTFIILFVFLFLLFFQPIEAGDSFWHLATGRWIVENAKVPQEDPFSFLDKKQSWVFTQWLGSTIFYAAYWLSGIIGLKLFRAFIFLLVIAIFLRYARKTLPAPMLIFTSIVMAMGLSTRCFLRPLIFNFIFVQLLLIILFDYLRTRDVKKLRWIPFLGIFWSNLHLGSFVYGNLILFTFLFGEAVELLKKKTGRFLEENGNWSPGTIKSLSLALLAFNLSFFVSPYGYKAALYPFKVFLNPDFINFYKFNDIISEQAPPGYIFTMKGAWFHILLVCGSLALFFDKKNKLMKVLLFIFAIFLFLRGQRASGYFSLISVYIIVESLRSKSAMKSLGFLSKIRFLLLGLILIFLIIFSVQLFNRKAYSNGNLSRYTDLDVLPKSPLKAVDFLIENGIEGAIFNLDKDGGYINWSGYPKLKSFVDGRQLNQELMTVYFQALGNAKTFLIRTLDHFKINIVLWDSSQKLSFPVQYLLRNDPDWQLVFIDGYYLVFVRKGVFDLPGSLEQLESELKSKEFSFEDFAILKDIMSTTEMERPGKMLFVQPGYNGKLANAITLYNLGFVGASIKGLLQIFETEDNEMIRNFTKVILEDFDRNLGMNPQLREGIDKKAP